MPPPRRRKRDRRAAGFTLIEVLVALVIAAIGLHFAFEMFSTHTRLLEAGVQERRAVALADSLLARVGTEIAVQPGSSSGSFDKEYRWRLQVTPFPSPGGLASRRRPVWGGAGGSLVRLAAEQSLRVQTLKLAPPPAASQ